MLHLLEPDVGVSLDHQSVLIFYVCCIHITNFVSCRYLKVIQHYLFVTICHPISITLDLIYFLHPKSKRL